MGINNKTMHRGCQSVFDTNGETLFLGEWDPLALFEAISDNEVTYWEGRRVLDIGANTAGLSLEIARRGASVVALEPDPYLNSRSMTLNLINQLANEEGLSISCEKAGLFDAHQFGNFDTVLCLGLIYHFRDPQYCLDYLSTMRMQHLIVSCQTEPGEELILHNRRGLGSLPKDFFPESTILTGWRPTRPLFERMLQWAGFTDIRALTDPTYNFPQEPSGLTNSAYYKATQAKSTYPGINRQLYYPR